MAKNVLLHFTTLKSAALIVRENCLNLGDFHRSNDLHENLKRLHAMPFRMERLPDSNYRGSFSEKSELIDGLGNIRFLSFCKAQADGDGKPWYVKNDKLAFRKMWGQYADKFGGACLIFDKEKLVQAGEQWRKKFEPENAHFSAFEVEYKKTTSEIQTNRQLKALSNFEELQKHFSIKHSDWEDEQEFRFLFRSSSDDMYFPPISLHDSLIGVLLGEKNNPNLRDQVYETAELGFVNLLRDKIHEDLQNNFINFSSWSDAQHFPDASNYPLEFNELQRRL